MLADQFACGIAGVAFKLRIDVLEETVLNDVYADWRYISQLP